MIYNLYLALAQEKKMPAELSAYKQKWRISDHVIPVIDQQLLLLLTTISYY